MNPNTDKMASANKFVAGNLSLDFHNTVSWDSTGKPLEDNMLGGYESVVNWAVEAATIGGKSARNLLKMADSNPRAAADALARVLKLRQVLHDIFAAVGRREHPEPSLLEVLNQWISAIPLRVKYEGDRFVWDWTVLPTELTSVVWPVVWSAAMLLRSDDSDRVGECEAVGCGWLFVDHSRRHNRKWCEMETCGNRAKAQRHYLRKRRRSNVGH